jgi:hypothetical protein
MDYPQVDPPMDPPDAPVRLILERAARITSEEAEALDAALRSGSPTTGEAQDVLDDYQRYLNYWVMFDHWPHPYIEMCWARDQVDAALGLPPRPHQALEPDDGSVAWGAATATAYAVLAAGRAGAPDPFMAAWVSVIGE